MEERENASSGINKRPGGLAPLLSPPKRERRNQLPTSASGMQGVFHKRHDQASPTYTKIYKYCKSGEVKREMKKEASPGLQNCCKSTRRAEKHQKLP